MAILSALSTEIVDKTDNTTLIILVFVALVSGLLIAYLLHKAGGLLQMQDERDKKNWEVDDDDL
jgi:uncharacterized membrane protein